MKIKYVTAILATICIFSFLNGCRSPKMEIPSYVWIDSVDFRIMNAGQQGTASHKITDVWITTSNGENLGMYQIPARIPILESGATRLNILAGIMIGGVPQKRFPYPFYMTYTLTADLKKGKIDTLIPHFMYDTSNTKFYLIEEFESAGILFAAYDKSAPLNKTSDNALIFHYPKEINGYSGLIELPYKNDSATVYHFEIRTIDPINLTYLNMNYCLMEINFCITDDVEIGMIAHSANSSIPNQQIPLANLSGIDKTKPENPVWKKVYVNFTQEIRESSAIQMKNFDIYIRGTISTNEKARYLFDNIKLVYN